MGGYVGVIVKKENSEQVAMNRWTNVMPYHFTNIDLYLGNTDRWYKEFAQEWQGMKEDYEKNKDTGNYEHNMTSSYFPHDTASPREYGLIAVDLKNKKIYSSQDYCAIGVINLYKLYSEYDENNNRLLDKELLKSYYDNGFLKEFSYYDTESKKNKSADISALSFDELVAVFEEIKEQSRRWEAENEEKSYFSHPSLKNVNKTDCDLYSVSLPINSDWEVVTYISRSLGVLKIRQEMENDGFIFTQEDNNAWKEYLSWAWYDEEESELENDVVYQEFKSLYKEILKEDFVIMKEEKQNPALGYVNISHEGDTVKFKPV